MSTELMSFYTGSIRALDLLAAADGYVSVEVTNRSAAAWHSNGNNPVFVSYHWLDENWRMVVFDGLRSSLPVDGVLPGNTARISVKVLPSPFEGKLHLMFTLVHEGVRWFEDAQAFRPSIHSLQINKLALPIGSHEGMSLEHRIRMTTSCQDCDQIPKVANAGEVFVHEGRTLQIMHEGSRVLAGGYNGDWMTEIILKLKGHHEPQEELLFHHLLKWVPSGSLMVELGAFWSYYSNWFLGAIPYSQAICVEPKSANLRCGENNLALNGRKAAFVQACVGETFLPDNPLRHESDGTEVIIPQFDLSKILNLADGKRIELLHMDVQGAELPFLRSFSQTDCKLKLRFLLISTHHKSISGSATTHRDCLDELIRLGATILVEHSIEESFSGDGLILASFDYRDIRLPFPRISRNSPQNSLFGEAPDRIPLVNAERIGYPNPSPLAELLAKAKEVQADFGPMLIMEADQVIGASLREVGTFQEKKIAEVVAFLQHRYEFKPEIFVDIGANIGTHLISSLKDGLFRAGVGVEADPINYALLTRNVVLNGLLDRIQLVNRAISDRCGAVTMELCKNNFGDHRVRSQDNAEGISFGEDEREIYSTMSDTMDELFPEQKIQISSNTLVWIDTQGHEGQVLAGAQKIFFKEKPFVVLEFWPYGLERSGGKNYLFDFLKKCRAIYDINTENWQQSLGVSCQWLESLYETMLMATRADHYPHTDLLIIL